MRLITKGNLVKILKKNLNYDESELIDQIKNNGYIKYN